jgi:nitroreductase
LARPQESFPAIAESNKRIQSSIQEHCRMPQSIIEVNEVKHAPKVDRVLPIFHERWSPRAFDHRDVSPADLAKVFEAARWAASSGNSQPWRFLVGTRNSETHNKIYEALVEFNKEWAGRAPVLILGTALAVSPNSGKPNGYALYDLGAASANLTLQAASQGLATHQMAGFSHDTARKLLEIPENYALGSVIALGYQAEPASLSNDKLHEREVAPRERKPLSEIAFSSWDVPADLT